MVLRQEDFGGNPSQELLPHLGVPSWRFLEMFYEKVGSERREVLDKYAEAIIEKGRMLTLQEAREWAAYRKEKNGKNK